MPESEYKNIQIESKYHTLLRELAQAENRSMSNMVEVLVLREYLRNRPAPASTPTLSQLSNGPVWVTEE